MENARESGGEKGRVESSRLLCFFVFFFEARTDENMFVSVSIYLKRNDVSPRPRKTAL